MERKIQKVLSNYNVFLRDYQYNLELKINEITNKSIEIKQVFNYKDILKKYQMKKILPLIVRLVDICENKSLELNCDNDNCEIKMKDEIITFIKIQVKKIIINVNDKFNI
jgi:hypothetical protein